MTLVRSYRWLVGCGLCCALGYGWWATGLRQFTPVAYVAVGIPLVAVAGCAALQRGRGRWSASGHVDGKEAPRPEAPLTIWVVIGAAALALEGVGLALGGRSSAVPTLSDVVDHLLVWHSVRAAVFAGWLMGGIRPLVGATSAAGCRGRVT